MIAHRRIWSDAAALAKVGKMNYWRVMLASGVFLIAMPSALGANAEGRKLAAKKACMLGNVDKGVEILADLYLESNDATYIFNQGRCFEQNGQSDQAALRFKEYLRKAKNLSQTETDEVLTSIANLEVAASHRKKEEASEAAEARRIAHLEVAASHRKGQQPGISQTSPQSDEVLTRIAHLEVAASHRKGQQLGISQTSPQSEPPESRGVFRRWWFWTGAVAVVVAGSVTAILLANRSSDGTCGGTNLTCVEVR